MAKRVSPAATTSAPTPGRDKRLELLGTLRSDTEQLVTKYRDVLTSFLPPPGGAPVAFGKETPVVAQKAAAAWAELPPSIQVLFAPATGPALTLRNAEVDALNAICVLGTLFTNLASAALVNAQGHLAYDTNLFVDRARAFTQGIVPTTDAALVQARCAPMFSLIDSRIAGIQRRKSKGGALRNALAEERSARETLEAENEALRGEAPTLYARPTPPTPRRRNRTRRRG